MSVRQFYFSSRVDISPGSDAVFHIRGMPPGLTPEDQKLLTDLIAYMLPPRLDPRQIAAHPIALRYKYFSPTKSILLCTQSTGYDEQGHPGTFFTHALILAPEPFTRVHPSFYWGSPFWRASDSMLGAAIPALTSFEVEPWLRLDQVWEFIAGERRRDWLYHVLCAVIHSHATQRRLVIVDTPEHVALWVAAVSLMLPPLYRPLLSFATYHHDPHQASYLITGARSDMDFKLTPANFLSFFTLDTEKGRISDADDSTYARFAVNCARPDLYEQRMRGLLNMCDRLFPPDGAIGEQLDEAAAYYTRVISRSGPLDATARQALPRAIATLDQAGVIADERLKDLQDLHTLLLDELAEAPDPELVREYERVAGMMRAADQRDAIARLPRDLWMVTRLLASGETQQAREISEIIRRTHGESAMTTGLNSPEYLRNLTQVCESAPLPAMVDILRFTGKGVKASLGAIPAFLALLKRAPFTADGALTAEGAQVIQALADSTRSDGQGWLTALVRDKSIPPAALWAYYYALVSHLSPEERAPYRALAPYAEALPEYEITHDLNGDNRVETNLAVLERWAEFAREESNGRAWVSTGLNYLWGVSAQRDLPVIAKRALMRPVIVKQVNEQSVEILLHAALSALPLARPGEEDLALCQQYWQHPHLNNSESALLIGVLAMYNGQLDHQSAMELRERFFHLSPEQYAIESRELIYRFFEQDVTRDAHAEMIVATYNPQYNDIFWRNYWRALLTLMADPTAARKAVSLLGFWFDSSLSVLGGYPYVVQAFFMGLPRLFEAFQKERGYREAAPEIDHHASERSWYPLVKDLIAPERKGILSKLGL